VLREAQMVGVCRPAKKLVAARERMIEDRRALADAPANEYEGGHTERMRVSFTAAQNTIEAIDRALRTRC
jgi:hypothetical protein